MIPTLLILVVDPQEKNLHHQMGILSFFQALASHLDQRIHMSEDREKEKEKGKEKGKERERKGKEGKGKRTGKGEGKKKTGRVSHRPCLMPKVSKSYRFRYGSVIVHEACVRSVFLEMASIIRNGV